MLKHQWTAQTNERVGCLLCLRLAKTLLRSSLFATVACLGIRTSRTQISLYSSPMVDFKSREEMTTPKTILTLSQMPVVCTAAQHTSCDTPA